MKPIRAVVLAGDNESGELIRGKRIKNKALYPINDRPMLNYVLDVLTKIQHIEEVVVVGPSEQLLGIKSLYSVNIVHNQKTIMENVKSSKKGWAGNLLIVTSDIPMVTVESIQDFINQALKYQAHLYYPIVTKQQNEELFPGIKRTYVALKEGTFTGGNVCLVDANSIDMAAGIGEKFIKLRKSPLRLANFLGWKFAYKLLTKKLTISQLEEQFSNIVGIKAKAIISNYPQLGTDIDKDSDLDIAEKYLANLI